MKKKTKFKKISCRMMKKEDVGAVAVLHSQAFHSVDDDELAKRVRSKTSRALVAVKNDGTIVGYTLFDFEMDEKRKVMYVANVGVSAKHRGRGVCGVMVPWLVARLGRYKCKSAYLSVFSGNDSAVRCYTRAGFKFDSSSGMMRMQYRVPRKRTVKKRKAA